MKCIKCNKEAIYCIEIYMPENSYHLTNISPQPRCTEVVYYCMEHIITEFSKAMMLNKFNNTVCDMCNTNYEIIKIRFEQNRKL